MRMYKEFEMSVGNLCNFKCKYCIENSLDPVRKQSTVSWDSLKRWSDYIHWARRNIYKDDLLKVTIFGGEPTLQLDNLDRFIGRVAYAVNNIHIVTNALLPGDIKEKLLKLKRFSKIVNLRIIASYDFSNQNDTRQEGTYQIVRDNIKWLYHNMKLGRCITVFSAQNFHKMHEVFFDYLELKNELPNLHLDFNIDRYGDIPLSLDETAIRESLSKIKDYIDIHPEIRDYFQYNSCIGIKRSDNAQNGCFCSGIIASMAEDGSLYPGYDVTFESDTVSKLLYIGHITEPFEEIERKRHNLLSKLPTYPNPVCIDCNVPCRVFPWRVVKTSLSEWNSLPSEGHCKIHKLIGEYLH